MTGASPRRTVSTSGSSGMVHGFLTRDIAPLACPRYGPAQQGLFAMPRAGDTTHFGFHQVPLRDKQALVDDEFRNVGNRYALMNDLMSGGLHRAWKDALVTAVNPPKSARSFALLDLAGGTGDI